MASKSSGGSALISDPVVEFDKDDLETAAADLCKALNITTDAGLNAYIDSQTVPVTATALQSLASLQTAVNELQTQLNRLSLLNRRITKRMFKLRQGPG